MPNIPPNSLQSTSSISSKFGKTGSIQNLVHGGSSFSMGRNSNRKLILLISIISAGSLCILGGSAYFLMCSGSLVGKVILFSLPSKKVVCASVALVLLGSYAVHKAASLLSRQVFHLAKSHIFD